MVECERPVPTSQFWNQTIVAIIQAFRLNLANVWTDKVVCAGRFCPERVNMLRGESDFHFEMEPLITWVVIRFRDMEQGNLTQVGGLAMGWGTWNIIGKGWGCIIEVHNGLQIISLLAHSGMDVIVLGGILYWSC